SRSIRRPRASPPWSVCSCSPTATATRRRRRCGDRPLAPARGSGRLPPHAHCADHRLPLRPPHRRGPPVTETDDQPARVELWPGDPGTLPLDVRRTLIALLRGPYLSQQRDSILWATLRAHEQVIRRPP